MELNASRFDVETPSTRKGASPSRPVRLRDDKTNPRSRRMNRSSRANAFVAYSAEVLRELNPRGPLESVMAEHVVATTWRLKNALARQATRIDSSSENPDRPSESPKRVSASAADRAARSVREALELLDSARTSRGYDKDPIPVEATGWPVSPVHSFDESSVEESVALDDEAPNWSERLVFDFEISDSSPVVKGTWITVGHIVSLIVDGQSWADILRSHPELTEEDVRVCVAYAVAQDQDED